MSFLWIWLAALAVEFLLFDYVGFMMVGVIFWTFTAVFVWCLIKGFAADKGAVWGCAIYTGVVGLLIFMSRFLEELLFAYTGKKISVPSLVFGWSMGGIFLLLGLYMGVIKRIQCSERVEAVCMEHRPYHGRRGSTYYSPVFEYKKQSKCYRNSTGEVFSRRKISKKFVIGQTYRIYVNPSQPMIMRTSLKIGGSNWLMLIVGALIVWSVTRSCFGGGGL